VSSGHADETPAVERALAFDMVKRGLPAAPIIVAVAALLRGADGAASAALAVAVVLVNLVLAAITMAWAARISPAALMAAALGGFLVRMAIVTGVVWLVQDEPWIDLPTLAVAILVTHLGLLAWETRYVSTSLAFPGLMPPVQSSKEAYR
jgi:hypothetical protein